MDNKVLIFSAPSGAGKSTIVGHILGIWKDKMEFSISATSRAPRGTEQNGREYHFVSPDEFRRLISEDSFVEYEEVYKDHFYGTLKSEVERIWAAGHVIIFDVDVKGACRIKQQFGHEALSLLINPPSIDELRRRLEGRATDSPEVIESRLARAAYELTFAPKFDHVIVNDQLPRAQQEALAIIKQFLDQQ